MPTDTPATGAQRFEAIGGSRLDGGTRSNLIDTYRLEFRGGRVFWLDAHKRTTAQLVASRYDKKSDAEADVWSGSNVGIWTSSADVIEDIRDTVPDEEIVGEIRGREVDDDE